MAHIDLGRHILEAAGRAAAIAAGGAAAVTAAAATAGGQSAAVASLLSLRGGDAAAAAGDVGMLALALAVAQVPEGAQALHDRCGGGGGEGGLQVPARTLPNRAKLAERSCKGGCEASMRIW